MFQFPGSSAAFGHMTFFIHHVTEKLVKRLGTRLARLSVTVKE